MKAPFSFLSGGSNPFLLPPVDFTTLPLGPTTAAAILALGMVYTRLATVGSNDSVQTSPGVLGVSDAALITGIVPAVNLPLIGDGATGPGPGGRGLVRQGACQNLLAAIADSRNMTTAGWLAGTGTPTANFGGAASPDGPAVFKSTRWQCAAGQFSNYNTQGGQTNPVSLSCYLRSPPAAVLDHQSTFAGGGGIGNVTITTASQFWRRITVGIPTNPTSLPMFFIPEDGSDQSARPGGQGAQARDGLVDCNQWDTRLFPTEYIEVPNIQRNQDNLAFPDASACTDAGLISLMMKSVMKHAAAVGSFDLPSLQPFIYVWAYDATHFARINVATMKLELRNGGAIMTSTNPFVWARYDTVETFVAAGTLATIAKYRLNGGAAVDLVPASTLTAYAPGAVPFYTGTAVPGVDPDAHTWCWDQRYEVYKSGRKPTWA